jgi:UDP-N-acetylglucosamine 2-epimerase (non-hydrolysing)
VTTNHCKRVLVIYGTRPEIIKLAPVILALNRAPDFEALVCATGQHRSLLDQMSAVFQIEPDFDLNVMTQGQTLCEVTNRVLHGMTEILSKVRPDFVIVQGDTTTTFASSLAAFYENIPVAHVEAGLRTFNRNNPFPEEINRVLTTRLASIHFAPTEIARTNLLKEGVDQKAIIVTGNTIVDALHWMMARLDRASSMLPPLPGIDWDRDIVILVTAHRRESWGEGLAGICKGLIGALQSDQRIKIVFPVHPNPTVRNIVSAHLRDLDRVYLIEPLAYPEFISLMTRCHLVVTDSGGVQEEVASLSKPVVITRETTERPEVVACGLGKLVGTDVDQVSSGIVEMLSKSWKQRPSPYGDGHASERTVEHLRHVINGCSLKDSPGASGHSRKE